MYKKPIITALFIIMGLTNCAKTQAQKAGADAVPLLAQVAVKITGVNWYLLEVKTPNRTITLDRAALEADGMGNVFSLQFMGKDRVVGTGAPNKYNAPCTWSSDSTLTIGTMASTMMLAFKEPEALKENEFFNYLEKAYRLRITAKGQLELFLAPDSNGKSTVMVFAQQK